MSEHTFTFTDEELQCIRVCVQNAPTPYDIGQKKIVSDVVDKIGEPIREVHPPLKMPKYDLSKYGITD
tara:strand:- start:270 stop:473 length:204 start_codon:yes stop_codon:yes gene_type:complete